MTAWWSSAQRSPEKLDDSAAQLKSKNLLGKMALFSVSMEGPANCRQRSKQASKAAAATSNAMVDMCGSTERVHQELLDADDVPNYVPR
jgi:hypothetical protein